MGAPSVWTGNRQPTCDGQINLYSVPVSRPTWFNAERRVVFVNGMKNSPEEHKEAAVGLSELQACTVIGVYNASVSFASDIGQCIRDKLTLSIVQSATFVDWYNKVEEGYQTERKTNPALSKIDYVARTVKHNAATLSLYDFLVRMLAGERSSLKFFAHSQGNLITSNALTAVALALGPGSISGLEVNSYGSPCHYWPQGVMVNSFAFTFDPVALLDARVGFSTSKVGFVGLLGIPFHGPMYAHKFVNYMKYDSEFNVNRFRWGSFWMTAHMDEAGLAEFCVSLGTNTARLTKIFERLKWAHWSDSDDVTYEYVSRMHKNHDGTMRTIAHQDRGFVKLLIGLLDAGWTTGEEKHEMEYLSSLL
jgi:hypothetical protein